MIKWTKTDKTWSNTTYTGAVDGKNLYFIKKIKAGQYPKWELTTWDYKAGYMKIVRSSSMLKDLKGAASSHLLEERLNNGLVPPTLQARIRNETIDELVSRAKMQQSISSDRSGYWGVMIGFLQGCKI